MAHCMLTHGSIPRFLLWSITLIATVRKTEKVKRLSCKISLFICPQCFWLYRFTAQIYKKNPNAPKKIRKIDKTCLKSSRNLRQVSVWFASGYVVIWRRLRGEVTEITASFDACCYSDCFKMCWAFNLFRAYLYPISLLLSLCWQEKIQLSVSDLYSIRLLLSPYLEDYFMVK